MILQFDKNKIQLIVLSSPTETVTPSEELKEINNKLLELKEKMDKFLTEEVNPVFKEVEQFVSEFNKQAT